jgi:hypothetical protein
MLFESSPKTVGHLRTDRSAGEVAVAGGVLKGQMIPSVRELARELASTPTPSPGRIGSCRMTA